MSKYLDYLIEAFQQVEQKYYSWWSIKHFNGKVENQQINYQRIERVLHLNYTINFENKWNLIQLILLIYS